MPAPKVLAGLPKPVLFGLYGAVGGLLGALVFAEPLWRAVRPPLSEQGPQVAVTASKDVEVFVGRDNEFAVEIARAGFDGPVEVRFENLPPGATIEPVTIPTGATAGRAKLAAQASAAPATRSVKVIAAAKVERKTITAETTMPCTVSDPTRPQADVVFVLDVTQSMDWAINGVRDGIGRFAADMRQNRIDFRVGVVAFRDSWNGEPGEVLRFRAGQDDAQVFTSDENDFRREVGKLNARGGGDAPESALDAILDASAMPFRPGATRVLLLITDNPPKNLFRQGGQSTDEQAATPAEVRDTAARIKAAGIDFIHQVNHLRNREIYRPIQEAGTGQGRFFELAKVASGEGFDALIADLGREVVAAAKAKSPDRAQVGQAEKPAVKSLQSERGYAEGSEGRLLIAIGLWTAAIAGLVCLALLAGQHHYLRGSLPAAGGLAAGLGGGFAVGLIGGIAGQGLFLLAPDSAVLGAIFRIVGWALLGGLAGAGLAFFVPNLKWVHGLAGGALGGAAGAIGYFAVTAIVGDVPGRLVGGLLLGFCIGLMVAVVEAAFRRAWLEVRYGARETITVNLGPEPVKVGGDSRMCTVWARGAAPVALRYFVRNGQVICEDTPARAEVVASEGDAREVGNVTVTVRTGTSAAPVAPTAPRPSVPPVPPRPAPVPPPLDLEPRPAVPARPPLPQPTAAPVAATKAPVATGPREPDACPSCGRKNPGRPGARYCMVCDQTY